MAEPTHWMAQFFRGLMSRNFAFGERDVDPSGGDLETGMVWFNTVSKIWKSYNGSTVREIGAAASKDLAGLLRGSRLTWGSVSTLTIGTSGVTSVVRDSTNVYTMSWMGTLTADIATSGAGGLDTGSEASATWYAVHVIGDTTDTNSPAAMLSTSSTAPTMPSGYDVFRRVGWVRNDGAMDFLKFYNTSPNEFFYDEEIASTLLVLVAGTATAFTTIGLTTLLPPTAISVDLNTGFTSAAASRFAVIRPAGGIGVNPPTYIQNGLVTGVLSRQNEVPVSSSQELEYKVSNADSSLSASVIGYEDLT